MSRNVADPLGDYGVDDVEKVTIDQLVGSIYRVPDRWWGFDSVGRDDHPGVCVQRIANSEKVQLLKGTDQKSARYGASQVLVEPDDINNLKKATSFSIRPYPFSSRRIARLHFDRRIGALRKDLLKRMQTELTRVFGNLGSSKR